MLSLMRSRVIGTGPNACLLALVVACGLAALVAGCGKTETDNTGHTPSTSATRTPQLYHQCPGRGLKARSLGASAVGETRALLARRLGPSPPVDFTIYRLTAPRQALVARSSSAHPTYPRLSDRWINGVRDYISDKCGPTVARRVLYVTTWDHRWDGTSASIAQHRFYVSRFQDGYHVWYWEH
jgi:hypothetical protein